MKAFECVRIVGCVLYFLGSMYSSRVMSLKYFDVCLHRKVVGALSHVWQRIRIKKNIGDGFILRF